MSGALSDSDSESYVTPSPTDGRKSLRLVANLIKELVQNPESGKVKPSSETQEIALQR